MTAAEARALCRNLHCLEEDLHGDLRALDALGRWLIRFTPVVSRGWDSDNSEIDLRSLPAVLFLDLTGSERLFGGIHSLVDRVKNSLVRFRIPVRIALAPTPGAAWAFAFTGGSVPRIIGFNSLLTDLKPLPVESLRIDETILRDLRHLGLHRISDVLALPREQLPSRFGTILLKRLDQLIGARIEPLTKLVNDPPITARMEFDAPVEALEDIWRIFEKLLHQVLVDLAARNHGARQLRMLFKPDRGWGRPIVTRTLALSRAQRDHATLLNLIRCEVERVGCDHGFERFQLDVPLHESVADGQTQLFEQVAVEEEIELDRLLQRLRTRLGEAAVIRPILIESYLPERAWRPGDAVSHTNARLAPSPRPLTLFSMPIEIRVVCEPSDDRTGKPRQFTWQGNAHRVTHAVGPERIAGEWWRGHRHTRDYYDAADEVGQRFWLFRVLHDRGDKISARWFLHGQFD